MVEDHLGLALILAGCAPAILLPEDPKDLLSSTGTDRARHGSHCWLRRHRRVAWAYTVFDVLAANALFAIAAYFVYRAPTLPVLVWSISVFVFTAIALGGAIWSRRDALAASADPTADFVAALRLRLDRRARAAVRSAARHRAAAGGVVAVISWPAGQRARPARDALCREPEPLDAPDPPGDGDTAPVA
ncbi:MAG TPA: hypothetical protein VHT91_00665 [Kofleriaceae bacterium]|nr:hypothetical protein [Kofleriaceae bacterium]